MRNLFENFTVAAVFICASVLDRLLALGLFMLNRLH